MRSAEHAQPAVAQPGRAGKGPARAHLLDLDDFSREELDSAMGAADAMREVLSRDVKRVATLQGRSVVTLFYEPSTRTRVSFEQAGKALGADVVNLAVSSSSVSKGESLLNTVRTLQAAAADVVVLRHPHAGAPYLLARHVDVPLVNAGDGAHAHPTQALLDLYTLRRHLGSLEGRRIAIVGDVLYSRVARSNLWGLTAAGADVVLCGPPTLLPAAWLRDGRLRGRLSRVSVTTRLEEALEGADAVMALRLQRERQQSGLIPSLREYARMYQVNEARLAKAKAGAVVLHPGPVNEGVELEGQLARGARSLVDEQVSNGVAVRMAVLYRLAAGPRAGWGEDG